MRQVEARPDAASRVPARPAVAFTKTFHTCVGLVFANAGRRRKVAVAQLSSQSALWRTEPAPFYYCKLAPPAQLQRLRIFPETTLFRAEKVPSIARESEDPQTKTNPAPAFCP